MTTLEPSTGSVCTNRVELREAHTAVTPKRKKPVGDSTVIDDECPDRHPPTVGTGFPGVWFAIIVGGFVVVALALLVRNVVEKIL